MAEPLRKPYGGKLSPETIAWMERRAKAFGDATSSKRGKPLDGVTYGAGKPPAKKGS